MTFPAQAIEVQLIRDADSLSEGESYPLDLRRVLRRVGAALVVDEPRKSSSHGSLFINGSDVRIVVRRDRPRASLSPRERFTIAHELGHFFIQRRFGVRPGSEGEYWRIEGLCNRFAGRLLLPPSVVADALSPSPNSSARLLWMARRLSGRHSVSFQVAGNEIVSYFNDASFFEIRDRPEDGRLGRVVWCAEGRQFVGGSGRLISPGDSLATVLLVHQFTREGEAREAIVNDVRAASIRTNSALQGAILLPRVAEPATT